MIREFVLQLKLGSLRPSYFAAKYGEDVLARYRDQLGELAAEGFAHDRSRSRGADPRRAAARRQPAAALLQARTRDGRYT